jgi:hypothetical protein
MNFFISIDMSLAVEFLPKNLMKFPSGSIRYCCGGKEGTTHVSDKRKKGRGRFLFSQVKKRVTYRNNGVVD